MQSTMMDYPLTVTTIMHYGTTVHGDSEVVTFTGTGARRATYAEVGRRVARLANALRRLGISGDQRVGTFMWNNQEHLEAYLAIPSMGAVLHTLNIRLFPDQLAYVANHAEDEAVIVDASLIPVLARVLGEMKTVRHVLVVGEGDVSPLQVPGKQVHSYEELLAAEPETFDWPSGLDERSGAAMCYTSGTTGNPKGVVYSHRSMYLHSMGACMGNVMALSGDDYVLAVVPMFHANSWGLPYAAMLVGASLLMPDRFLQAEPLARMIEAERPTFSGAVPTIWSDVLRYAREQGSDLSSMRMVICGGSAVPRALMEAFQNDFGVPIVQAWGMTETSPLGSVARPPRGLPEEARWEYRDTQGRLTCAVEGRIVDDGGQPLPHDGKTVGELQVRGPWVTASYYKDDDPEKFHEGWLRTGDVGTIDPRGFIRLTDRAKDVIKSGGEWISSVELENLLMAHPEVLEAAVIGVPDEKWDERPLAIVVRREGAEVGAAQLREFIAGKVAKWQLPERWSFIDEVPKTSVGKFDKKVLRRQYSDGGIDVVRAE